ncbi:DUF572-domain-containing protein [Trichocladium antarcticum]|uniref:Splicing factor YJU2 n=1 Tax=Trichocladium antarcticum TaxID=1450529 RepID=A0AAN6UR93_9PEZI|nr:DUF572-domain-containing protein [Trichocladium antarcticum]
MAHLAHLGALTGDLVAAVTAIPENQTARRDEYRDAILQSLRSHRFTRTNQFEVEKHLRGLEEHFHVLGRDALGEALRQRLNAIEPHRTQFTPEILHFLLELADQPVKKSNISDLDLLLQPEEDAPPPLTWRDVAREDDWKQERDIWRFNDYSPDSSDEEEADVESEASLESLTTASSAEDRYQRTAQEFATKPQGGALLEQVEDAQSWRQASATDGEGRPKKIPISTTQLLREALFMLAGLETTLFDAQCNPATRYQLRGVSWDSYKALVTSFAECGRKLSPLRAFSKTQEQSPLLQVFQGSVQTALSAFDRELAAIQSRLVAIKEDVVVSLIQVLEELRPGLSPLYTLSDIVHRMQEERNPHAFRYLELMYDAVGVAQLQGQHAIYQLLGTIFFDCFRVYLRPIRLWMEEGKLVPGDRTFFVSESPTKLPLAQIWQSQFNLLRTPEGSLHAPRFLKPAIHRIFTAGKSIVVLKHMKQHKSMPKYRVGTEPTMDFATVCPDKLGFAPFGELFSTAFHSWIQSKHHTAAATLRELLFTSYGLSQGLDTLQHIYLMSDGAQAGAFAASVFRHLDTCSSSWTDRFTLTELAQEAFSASVDTYRLSAEIDTHAVAHSALALRNSVRHSLPAIRLTYRLTWPVQIIVPDDAIHGYQTLFTFLLQTRRAIAVLQQPLHTFRRLSRNNNNNNNNNNSTTPANRMASYHRLRTNLLWFCTTLLTYLTTLVLAPALLALERDLRGAADVDEMVAAHAAFVARALAEAVQGARLAPVRESVLDVFDLALRVEDAQCAERARVDGEEREVERLVEMASPLQGPFLMGGLTQAATMSERKVLTKYYPPDFDPSLLTRARKPKGGAAAAAAAGPKVQTVRLMAPFSLRCVACGEYMYRGRKFNARKETPQGERYLGIQLFRFYIRCTRCSAEIVFRTDPKNQDYVVEKGARRNTEPWRRGLVEGGAGGAVEEETDEQRLDRLEQEMAEQAEGYVAEERNAMAELEAKTADAKREMAVADALDEIRVRNARLERANREEGGDLLQGVVDGVVRPEEEARRREEEEDAEAARRAFAFVRRQEMLEEVVEDEEDGEAGGVVSNGVGSGSAAPTPDLRPSPVVAPSTDMPPPPLPTFKRQVKKKKDHAALLGIKKKQPLV